jgi:dTDP-glucose 4,6-dehydratase
MRFDDGRALPTFIVQALKGDDLTIFGDGFQTRSFCYVSDLIEGVYRLLFSNETRPVNIGNPDEISILDFAKNVIASSNSLSKIVFKSLPKDDPKKRKPDISRAKKVLNWSPEVSRGVGLSLTIQFFKKMIL